MEKTIKGYRNTFFFRNSIGNLEDSSHGSLDHDDEFAITSSHLFPTPQISDPLNPQPIELAPKTQLEGSLDIGHPTDLLDFKTSSFQKNLLSPTFIIPGVYIVFFCSIFSFISNNIKTLTYQHHSDLFITFTVTLSALIKCIPKTFGANLLDRYGLKSLINFEIYANIAAILLFLYFRENKFLLLLTMILFSLSNGLVSNIFIITVMKIYGYGLGVRVQTFVGFCAFAGDLAGVLYWVAGCGWLGLEVTGVGFLVVLVGGRLGTRFIELEK